jgi:hypothetical protein
MQQLRVVQIMIVVEVVVEQQLQVLKVHHVAQVAMAEQVQHQVLMVHQLQEQEVEQEEHK